nr:uncharacterized protein LOC105848253 isoform X4 [Hydra vulgaris]XP_047143652.1 uncharacterized protein LOC105848253 isoform X4 [Hydra vulgaris]
MSEWCRVKWLEEDKVYSDTVPLSWINGKVLRWPKKGAEKKLRDQVEPQDDWFKFQVLKIKLTDKDFMTCHSYNILTDTDSFDFDFKKDMSQVAKKICSTLPPKPEIKLGFRNKKVFTPELEKEHLNLSQEASQNKVNIDLNQPTQSVFSFQSSSKSHNSRKLRSRSSSSSCSLSPQSKSKRRPDYCSLLQSEKIETQSELSCGLPKSKEHSTLAINRNNFPMSDQKFQYEVIKLLCELKTCLQCQPKSTLSHNLSAEIPTQFLTVEDLNEFELKMHDNSFAQEFVKQLSRVGGKSSKYMIKDLIQRLMSNDFQKKFSMIGLKGKLKFEKTLLYNVINKAVLNVFPDATSSEVRIEVMNHLKYGADRKNRKTIRTSARNDVMSISLNFAEEASKT